VDTQTSATTLPGGASEPRDGRARGFEKWRVFDLLPGFLKLKTKKDIS
jgi:hypothetical protein